MPSRVVVTGARGFLGQHAEKALELAGHDVVSVHRTRPDVVIPGDLVMDLLAPSAARELAAAAPDVVVHCAAAIPLRDDGEDGTAAARTNLRLDQVAIDACAAASARLIYLSSSSVYGDAAPPWTETSEPRPAGPYARAKLESERVASRALSDRALALRVSAPYGVGLRNRTVLAIFLENALADRPLRYHGTGARRQVFTAAEDVADAIARAVERPCSGALNLAGARSISMRELAELVVRCVPGCRSRIEPSGQVDAQEEFRPEISIERARSALGWQPSLSLEQGIACWAAASRVPS